MNVVLPALARNVARLREEAKWTQQQLASASGCSSVAMIESGKRRSPRAESITAIAAALSKKLGRNVAVSDLYIDLRRRKAS